MMLSAGIINGEDDGGAEPFFYDGFEDGDVAEWTKALSSGTFTAEQTAFYGNYSSHLQITDAQGNQYVQVEISAGGIQPSQISFAFKDLDVSDAYGCAVNIGNSSLNPEATFMSNNPQWEYRDANGITQISEGVYQWTLVTVDFDWAAGTFSGSFEQLENGSTTTSFSGDLMNGVDCSVIEITNYSGGSFDNFSGNYLNAYFDEFEVVN